MDRSRILFGLGARECQMDRNDRCQRKGRKSHFLSVVYSPEGISQAVTHLPLPLTHFYSEWEIHIIHLVCFGGKKEKWSKNTSTLVFCFHCFLV